MIMMMMGLRSWSLAFQDNAKVLINTADNRTIRVRVGDLGRRGPQSKLLI